MRSASSLTPRDLVCHNHKHQHQGCVCVCECVFTHIGRGVSHRHTRRRGSKCSTQTMIIFEANLGLSCTRERNRGTERHEGQDTVDLHADPRLRRKHSFSQTQCRNQKLSWCCYINYIITPVTQYYNYKITYKTDE